MKQEQVEIKVCLGGIQGQGWTFFLCVGGIHSHWGIVGP